MDQDRSQQLCEICTNINFKEYFQHEIGTHVYERTHWIGADTNALRLGRIEDLFQKSSSCPFCRLVVAAIVQRRRRRISKTFTIENLIARNREEGTEMECWMYSYCYAIHNPSKTDSETANRIGIATRVAKGYRPYLPEDHAGDIQLLAEDAPRINKAKLFHGRVVDVAKLDMELARNWLRCCEREHGELCENPSSTMMNDRSTQPRSLMVVDVKRLCICRLPPGSRYVCLSYCWPIAKAFMLTQATLSELLGAKSLARRMRELPHTIQDAIQCVCELGEAYLWVDSLCIIQDNKDDKRYQISQMDRIFTSAFLTIVPVCSVAEWTDNLQSGLPRYRKHTGGAQQKIESVQSLRLAVPFDTLSYPLEISRWSTRAWTYEEGLLSRRILYFTEDQVYFQCSCSIFCEDGVGENSPIFARVFRASNLWNMGSPYTSDPGNGYYGSFHLQRAKYADPREAMLDYHTRVEDYTVRDLTYHSDILNAFKGIEAVMKRSMSTEFWYGLPESRLDTALLWTLYGAHKRRGVSVKGFTKSCFPSWTWAGWDSKINSRSYFHITDLRREINWYLINRKGVASLMATEDAVAERESTECNERRFIGSESQLPDHFLAGEQPRLEVDANDEDWRYPEYLACWTTLAFFCLSGDVASLGDDGLLWKYGLNLAIFNSSDIWVGSIMMNQEWVTDNLPRPQFEFMLMSRSKDIIDLPLSPPRPKYFDEEKFVKRPWCMLNVMLIERENDIARRLGVGFIHEVAWVEANPTSMFIRLE